MLNSMINAITNNQIARVDYARSMSVVSKNLDVMEEQGDAAMKLIESAEIKPASTKDIDGRGTFLDMMG